MPTSLAPGTDAGPIAPNYVDVLSAAEQIAGHAVRTPVLESPLLNEKLGGRLLVKAECLQLAGAFKFWGAYNRISRLNDEEKKAGVVAFSSGNHAQGVALAAKLLGAPAVVVMPKDAPVMKIENARAYGAEIVLYDRASKTAKTSVNTWRLSGPPPWCRPMTTLISLPVRVRLGWTWMR